MKQTAGTAGTHNFNQLAAFRKNHDTENIPKAPGANVKRTPLRRESGAQPE